MQGTLIGPARPRPLRAWAVLGGLKLGLQTNGPDFPGETFRVLKEKETAEFREYRTRRLVLEAWDRQDRESVRA